MKKRLEEMGINMTPMIDVVFQLIIFFVVSVAMQRNEVEVQLKMALAPHGQEVKKVNPLTVKIDVDQAGRVFIARTPLTAGQLRTIVRKSVARYGQKNVPVVIRADLATLHTDVKKVMDICSEEGLWRINFAAIKAAAGSGK